MRTIYLDENFKCHVAPGEDRTAVETAFFDGKCDAFIEGYRYIPAGEEWTRGDGTLFRGEMASPWMDYSALEGFQGEYEKQLAAMEDMETALDILMGVEA